MARRGDGIYRRGRTWWLDFTHQGKRHVVRLGKGINRTVARELASAKRVAILKADAGIGPPLVRATAKTPRKMVAWAAAPSLEALAPLRARLGEPVVSLPAGGLLTQPLVYAWITAAGTVRYVGMSRKGLARPLTSRHHKAHHIELSDRLVVWPMATAEAAVQAEDNVLAAVGPVLNSRRPHASLHVVRPEEV
jgi:hypothetical protein